MAKESINREYKDRLFKYIFGNEKHKDLTLSLYNAINNTHYDCIDDIEELKKYLRLDESGIIVEYNKKTKRKD